MKKYKRIFSALIAAILLLGITPAYASTSTTGGLNGDVCDISDFNYDVYDVMKGAEAIDRIQWPASGNVLITVSGKYTFSAIDGVTIPTGIVVDVYQKSGSTFTLLAHYDTTDGKSITISTSDVGSGSGNSSGNTGNTGNTGSSDGSSRSPIAEPGKPLDHYSNSYDDVKPGDWYYDAVMTLTEGGLFNGYGNGKFGPNDTITWGQFQLVVSRLTGGKAYGDTSKIDLNTDVNKMTMTRGLTAVQMVETYKSYCRGYRYYPNTTFTSVDDFPDSKDIVNWCYEYMTEIYPVISGGGRYMGPTMDTARNLANGTILKSYELNMFHGTDSKGTFAPYNSLTRAQFCQILYNLGWLTADCEYFTK